MSRLGWLLLLVTTCLGGCGAPAQNGTPPQPAAESAARYQFEKDSQGRLFRLDRVTGEVTAIGTGSTERKAAAPETSTREPVQPPPRTATQTPSPEETARSGCPSSGVATVTFDSLDVFPEPREGLAPTASLKRGTDITVLQARGEWRLVRFNDPEGRQGTGYIPCSRVVVPRR